ncbi:tRNA (adenosine(37)-N6)-threonylcarbamoyltransferase complex ATPase subunit type 1 TsaE [Roseimarinus sediminis]|uniref:tRNA (adenosine(37)-N6)-threonylcarbamoyltransferase complex ATPase subunit type 1 TsaE n=1 Tax=Roseimarinus sediminis TaxID=1610899 RepID=UPI003D1B54A0
MKTIVLPDLKTIDQAATEFLELTAAYRIFAFYGAMGAGKTTFIKALCSAMGINDPVTSPSFSLVNEYTGKGNLLVYHFDCYRLKNIEEAYDMGADEYFYSGKHCFIEWPERIEPLLPLETLVVNIEVMADGSRKITIETD